MVAAVILAVPNVLALSVRTAYTGTVLGEFARLMLGLLNLVNIGVSVLSTGWAMSRVTHEQLGGLAPLAPAPLAPLAPPAPAFEAAEPVPVPAPVAVPRAAPRAAAPAASAPAAVSADGKRQCPKCGLYETERGSVIGWYCKVCGWREGRR
jgi:hypothetical protein